MAATDLEGKILFNGQEGYDEEAFSHLLYATTASYYVKEGLEITADFSANTFDVEDGYSVVYSPTNRAYLVRTQAAREVALTDNDVNYVYVGINPDADIIELLVELDTNPARDTSLLVAEIDTGADTVTLHNRGDSG
jgi:hypothetical protein